ncbi:MAG: N-acetyl-gamma-glutamyl-phosphate reductase [Hydrogenophilus thermoluteolus]|uniref:N-acetyl-gamma-glutamyl-phosphate reductase n=1 Tax=Hydrogenophilus thermoluteolus TaxID=297 RepID=UPI000EDC9DC0|nr:N-acetyl-gamma-glutamyl-phosphate reductase [Hydrogenophilus thermoluteolus]MBW7657103.1 N-acetyl-gamma-glutamyl-phosphate reductase [Hydrogenophilus thermoluteolus]GLW60749.1 N-acetyl-gamma-glutamyl-phosphate reductase [Hydrogenophilus thermoluteolus]HCO78121.1 N-acetyl-gamma-glutamyl-phosphate reductase [Rhodocyclaceae bacterium]HNQ47998.1 N-acetyl-gamma-glutamyl-phosphate reductase [Hydrogenophilus thermoluteolus]
MIRVGIVGGTGYTGVELLRLLVGHPNVALHAITSRGEAGTPVAQLFPSLRGRVDLAFSHPDEAPLDACDVVFFATPNGIAMHEAPKLLAKGVRVIDLAADFRLRDVAVWERWYGMRHASPEWVAKAVYGLPELFRDEIRTAQLVANPGCYPTAVQLGLAPLVKAQVVRCEGLIADCKSGVSGAGRKAEVHTLFAEASDNFKAYGVAGHRHQPEIVQGLARLAGADVALTFVPHLTPMIRGIHATLYAELTTEVDLQVLYETFYREEPFVDVLPSGSHPETRSVRAANLCRIAVHRPGNGRRVVVLSVIDNLMKGAAGQAVQNMNLMFGLPETTGLMQVPVSP